MDVKQIRREHCEPDNDQMEMELTYVFRDEKKYAKPSALFRTHQGIIKANGNDMDVESRRSRYPRGMPSCLLKKNKASISRRNQQCDRLNMPTKCKSQ